MPEISIFGKYLGITLNFMYETRNTGIYFLLTYERFSYENIVEKVVTYSIISAILIIT